MKRHPNDLTRSFRWLLLALCLSFVPIALFAQEAAEPAAQAAASNDATLMGAFKQGGIAMYPLLVFSIATVGLVIYNGLFIREASIINRDALKNEVQPALDQLDFAAAMDACEKNKGPVLNILYCGLETTQRGHFNADKIDKAFDEAASVELARPFVFVNYLQVIASVSPMVGLLGTVSGMVKAFRTISEQGMGRPELLANNISEALVTTASGLLVAIPALIAYFFFKNAYGKIAASVSQVLGRVLRDMTDRHENPSTTKA
jgi:biopolymer transport protein ExbB